MSFNSMQWNVANGEVCFTCAPRPDRSNLRIPLDPDILISATISTDLHY